MRAEVIAIGDELTSGVRLDTNSQWLSQQLEQVGLPVAYHTTVGDDLERIVGAVRTALERVEVIVISGGLGPTADDLTRQAIAAAIGQPLELDPAVLQHIRNLFQRRGREMPERNVVQAEFPRGSRVMENPHGTAPGIHVELDQESCSTIRHLFALPGVPAELKQMWTGSVEPLLSRVAGPERRVIRHRTIRCFGAGESDIEQRLPDLVRRGRRPAVGITASKATISLRITADGPTDEACYEAMEPTAATIYSCLGTLVYGEDDDTLQDALCRLLHQKHMTLGTVECGTQGLLGCWLSAASDADAYRGGIVIGNQSALEAILGLPSAAEPDPQSLPQRVAQMACEVRKRMHATLGLAVGPTPQLTEPDGSGGRIHFALATPERVLPASSVYASHPSIQTQRAAKEALNLARLWLLKQ